jgi:hypothetical protein
MLVVISLTATAILLVSTARVVAGSPTVQGYVCVVPGAFLILGFCCVSQVPMLLPTFMLNALLVLVAGGVCACLKTTVRSFVAGAVAVTALSYGVGLAASCFWWKELLDLRDRYPYQSLTNRLAYEEKQRETPLAVRPAAISLQGDAHDGRTEDDLAVMEDQLDDGLGRLRVWALEQLHEHFVAEFIDSPGFGVTRRLGRPSTYRIELPANAPIPLPAPDIKELSASAEMPEPVQPAQAGAVSASRPASKSLRDMHDSSIIDFVNAKGFGFVRDRDHVAGFQEHQFRTMPQLPDEDRTASRWQIRRLELVSLLKYDEPAVYVSEHLPRMDELREAPTRPLNAFEKSALADLQRGQDLRIQPNAEGFWMLGSIRALKACLGCHHGQRGDLLGAFSYKLRPELPGSQVAIQE